MRITLVSAVAAFTLAACQQAPSSDNQPAASPPPGSNQGVRPEPAPARNNVAAPTPDPAPPALTPEAERGETGARNLLLTFARAIEQRDFDRAWALLSPSDQQKWSRAQFAQLFADLPRPTVAVPTGEMDGGAGSLYYTAPITITGNDGDGRPVRLEGEAILRRVNDVDGATPAQLRWHFERVTLDWTH